MGNFLAASPGSKGLVPTKGDVFRRSWGVCFVQDGCWLLLVVGVVVGCCWLLVDCLFENSCETLNEKRNQIFFLIEGSWPNTHIKTQIDA